MNRSGTARLLTENSEQMNIDDEGQEAYAEFMEQSINMCDEKFTEQSTSSRKAPIMQLSGIGQQGGKNLREILSMMMVKSQVRYGEATPDARNTLKENELAPGVARRLHEKNQNSEQSSGGQSNSIRTMSSFGAESTTSEDDFDNTTSTPSTKGSEVTEYSAKQFDELAAISTKIKARKLAARKVMK